VLAGCAEEANESAELGSDGSGDAAALLDAAAYVPGGSTAEFYLPARMRDATGAVLPADDASAAEWQSYRETVVGGVPQSGGSTIGFGRAAEGRLGDTRGEQRVPPGVPGVAFADVEAQIDIDRVVSILAVDADARGIGAALESATTDMSVTSEDRDGGTLFDARCNGSYEECGIELVNGLTVWVGGNVVVAGLRDGVESALRSVVAPDEALRAVLSGAVDEGVATGSIVLAPMQVTADSELLGCFRLGVGGALDECESNRREQLAGMGLAPVDGSVLLVGSALDDGEVAVVLGVAVDHDEMAVATALRDWQANGTNLRNLQPLVDVLGPPEVSERDNVVIASYPIPAGSPAASRLWAEMFLGRVLPIVTPAP
jgi:hypothetical protein